jgi:DNA-binding Lrp family transcriptional regulator
MATRLVAIVLADRASHDGVAWIDQQAIVDRARVSESTARRAIRELEDRGELETRKVQRGRRRINVYRLRLPGIVDRPVEYERLPFDVDPPFSTTGQSDRSSAVDDRSSTTATTGHPRARVEETSLETYRSSSNDDSRADPDVGMKPRKRDPAWDALAALFGEPTTKTEKTHRGKIVREVRAALVDELGEPLIWETDLTALLRKRVAALRSHWRNEADVTQDALVKHWTLAERLAETGRSDAPPDRRAKALRWVEQVGVRMEDESDVRGFLEQIAAGTADVVEYGLKEWRHRRKEQRDSAA